MNHIYLGLTLSLICLFLAYLILSKVLLVTVLCFILAGLYFKDDFILFRYIAAHVALFYSWICDLFSSIQNMYHQSNNTNFPVRKSIENNGAVSRKFERLRHGSASYNLSTSYIIDNQPLNSGIWDSGSKLSSPLNSYTNQSQSTLQDMSKLNISHRVREENSTPDRHSKLYNSSGVSPLKIPYGGSSRSTDPPRSRSSPFLPTLDHSTNIENKPPLNTQLYADVTSPGFCGRVAERLHEEMMTHQSKYDTVGAFPVVNFKSQSPKVKIKTPVRVRLAPPSNELMHYSYGANTMTRSPALGQDDSMKSVLQVLKEISRKRIHSHVDADDDEGSKRLRVTDTQFDSDSLLHASLLQQTIQGKRAREESSPNEDDKKRRKASLRNNEILSSLSSSISIRPPHLQTAKRKAQSIDDSITSTPVLGKLLKVQTEITPPAPTNVMAAPAAAAATAVEELKARTSPSPAIPSPIALPPSVAEPAPVKTSEDPQPEEDGVVSRLLGRMSEQSSCSLPIQIPVKKNVFMSTNDLSLSPPKENRLAAMIAVLGGPSEQSELENIPTEAPKHIERLVKGKALFTSPETPATPETPKHNKKVTFSDSLTTTKIFDRDEPEKGNSVVSNNSLGPPSTPLSSVTFGTSVNTAPTGPKLNFGSENASAAKPFALNFGSSPVSSGKEADKRNESGNFPMIMPISSAGGISSPGGQASMFQMQSTSLSFTSASSPANISGPLTSVPAQVSSSNGINTSSPGGFSFGSNSSLVNASKDSLPKLNTDSPSVKPLSFGGESKTTQPAPAVSGFPSLFSPASNNGNMKATEAVSASAQNKPMFNMFGNKDTSSSTNKNESENKPMVNGFAPTSSSSSPFALSQPTSQANANKQFPNFAVNANPTTTSQSAPAFNFGSNTAFSTSSATSATTQQSTPLSFTSATQQANSAPFQPNPSTTAAASPALNMFNSSISSSAQSKPSPFGSGIQGAPAFGDSVFKPVSSSSQTPNSVFGSTPSQSSAFGSTTALQNGSVSSTSGISQSNNMFGSISSNKPVTFGSEPNATTQPSSAFGFSATPTSSQANSPFSVPLKNTTTSTPTMFGNTMTAQSTSVFGSGTPSTGPQSSTFPTPSTTAGQPSLFGNIVSNDSSKNLFAGAANSNPTFGGLGSISSPTFGNQSNPASTFGGQSTTAAPTFGNQSAPAFTFGSQSTGLNPTQGGFGSAGTFGGSSSSSSTNEVKPPAFGSASPFMFGNSSASKPTESVKPLGTATQFAFGSSAQQSSTVNPTQPSVPSFGGPTPSFGASQSTPTFGASQPAPTFGASQQTPTFGASQPAPTFGASQPAPTFGAGSSQPAAPTFQFGQTSAAQAFQFNAAPPTAGGGMFSIGSGGSSTSRPKTTALRRSHKRT